MSDQWLPSPTTPQPLSPQSGYVYYGSPATGTDGKLLPVATTPTPVAVTKPSEKRICGISETVFLLWCVVAFLVVSGVVLGGVFGSGILNDKE